VAAALVDSSRRHYRLRTIAPARQAGRPRRQQATTSTSTSTMTPCPPSPSPSLSSGAASLLLKPPTLLLRLVAASTPVAGHSSAGPSSGLAQVARCRFVQGESGADGCAAARALAEGYGSFSCLLIGCLLSALLEGDGLVSCGALPTAAWCLSSRRPWPARSSPLVSRRNMIDARTVQEGGQTRWVCDIARPASAAALAAPRAFRIHHSAAPTIRVDACSFLPPLYFCCKTRRGKRTGGRAPGSRL